jgi:hypothetical protein
MSLGIPRDSRWTAAIAGAVKTALPAPPATSRRWPDVRLGLRAIERRQVVAGGHALGELAQLAPSQHLLQLRLTHQHDLDQLLGVGLEVGDEADLLEHLGREVLRLVDQQHDVAPVALRLEQEAGAARPRGP